MRYASVLIVSVICATFSAFSTMVTYCPAGVTKLNCVEQLSDGTILIGGQAKNLSWIPQTAITTQLSAQTINSVSSGNIGFIMQLSSDGKTIERVVHFPAGSVRDVYRIKMTNIPGQATGIVYISGNRDVADYNKDGYYIARLNGNFISSPPTACEWVYNVECKPRRAGGFSGSSQYKEIQPWDVDNQGNVIYGMGSEFDYDWAGIYKLDKLGKDATVPYWRTHWSAETEYAGTIPDYSGTSPLVRSGIVLKIGRGSLRSWTQEDYDRVLTDGNGGKKKGLWPDDYYFKGPKGTLNDKGGYTGYKTSDKPTARLGAIVIDRRNNHLYFGYNNQSVLPGGNPDFEPAVVAMDEQGRLKWWSRCYHEWIDKNGNSTLDSGDVTTSSPDQYIDDLCIDYTAGQGGALVVVARCHGNNVINFWKGNEIKHSDNPKKAFQNQFTGSNGNIHISWIGRFSLDKEEIRHATFLAEVNEGQNPGGSYNDPLLDGWFNLNSGWAGLNTTKTVPNSAAVDAQGNVFVASMGRRTITTNNAYQQNLKPSEGKGCWNNFVRVYKKDLTLPVYSSLIVGQWNPQDGSGGGNTELQDVTSSAQGLIAVGYHTADTSGKANGNSIPTANVPSWGAQTPTGQTPFLAMLDFATALNPVLTPPSQTSIHTAIPRIKSITQSLRSLRITVSEGLVGKDLCLVTPQGRIVALAFDGTAYTANNLSAGMYYVSSKGGKFFIPVTFVNR